MFLGALRALEFLAWARRCMGSTTLRRGSWPKEQIGTAGDRLRAQVVDKARAEPASATDNPLSEFAALRGLDPGDLQRSSVPASLRPGHETGEPDC